MKILVISDSHGITTELTTLIDHYRDQVDYIVHCGDSELTSHDTLWEITDDVVKGNMDFDAGYKTESVLPVGAYRIFVTHGHFYNVNVDRLTLARRAKEEKCVIAFYGHTHILKAEMIENVLCINPGSFNRSRGPINERTYAIVTIEDTMATIQYYKADGTCLEGLTQSYQLCKSE